MNYIAIREIMGCIQVDQDDIFSCRMKGAFFWLVGLCPTHSFQQDNSKMSSLESVKLGEESAKASKIAKSDKNGILWDEGSIRPSNIVWLLHLPASRPTDCS